MSDPQKYTVGWICAITTEFVAAQALFDEKHEDLETVDPGDNNNYALGRIGKHNVVMAALPKSEYGTTSAAAVARDMLRSFPNVRIGLMVGIGGGAPSAKHDIRLGDVVVSTRDNGKGGVFQYDYGKAIQDKAFVTTGSLNQPPQLLLTAVGALEARYEMAGHRLNDEVDMALKKIKKRKKYCRPSATDLLYRSSFKHPEDSSEQCTLVCGDDHSHLVTRSERDEDEDNPAIHCGLIASANTLMKDALARDKLAADHGVLCFEMEAAGLMNHFPCLVIRGICDYSDSHKNKEWQGFAAMMAAAYAKDLLRQIPPSKVEAERPIGEVLGCIQETLDSVRLTANKTKDAMVTVRSDSHRAKVEHWLSPPDYSTNANLARERRHAGTGTWLLESTTFQEWKLGSRQHLWLYGLAGCGKTVLSTTILDYLLQKETRTTLAFFFDFNDTRKQTLENLLRSLSFQLYHSGGEAARRLDGLFARCDDGRRQPDVSDLSACVDEMVRTTGNVTVLLDALDECTMRKELLAWIQGFGSGNAQLLVTGRPEADLERDIPNFFEKRNCILLDKRAVNADIRSYVMATLEQDRNFVDKKLSQDLLRKIRDKVGDGADGMFRWAACQLVSLAKCLSPNAIEAALKGLPRDLDETYYRMLKEIPGELRSDATRLLQFLVYAKRPLKLSEAVEVIATKIDPEPGHFHVQNRLFNEADVQKYCPSLVSVAQVRTYSGTMQELHLAHFSVKEYLIKERPFDMESASVTITKTCLTYLIDIKGDQNGIRRDFPMARFAAESWMDHAISAETSGDIIRMAADFLQDESTFQRWGRLYQADRPWDENPGLPQACALYYACLCGLRLTARELMEEGADVNAQGGKYGNALQAALWEGHLDIVRLLVEKGADVNAQGGEYGNALQAASSEGYLDIVRLLVERGADINAQGGEDGNALQAASLGGHLDIVRLLVEKGADFNAQGGEYGNALQAASSEGHLDIVRLLVERGADVNAQGGKYGNALQAALWEGHLDIVRLLVEKGADVNAQGGFYGNALQAASLGGHLGIVRLLVEKGADFNAQGGEYGNALQAASSEGYLDIVRLLVERGADINAQGGEDGNALQAASSEGHLDIVRLLVERGADVNAQGGFYGNALQAASLGGHLDIVRLLVERGADVNAQGVFYGNALYAASLRGHLEIMRLLVEKGADINAQGGKYSNALQAASLGGHLDIVRLLVEKGADINAQGGEYSNALQAASSKGHLDIVRLLVERGADINAQGGEDGNALQAASSEGHLDIVRLLVERGADVNAQGVFYGNALYAASLRGHLDIVRLLVERGADINAQGGEYGNALQAASSEGYLDIVRLLVEREQLR
ncbi:hypothetical protein LRP88_04231 [Fusarium phalaenopsidis]